MSAQKILPVITSIVIILLVAVLRERSKTLAAIVATMPINIPLALWVVFGGENYTQDAALNFVRSIAIGLIPTFVWGLIVYVALRNGLTLLPAIGLGYAGWAVLTFTMLRLGLMNAGR
jgi:hypothetical protein